MAGKSDKQVRVMPMNFFVTVFTYPFSWRVVCSFRKQEISFHRGSCFGVYESIFVLNMFGIGVCVLKSKNLW